MADESPTPAANLVHALKDAAIACAKRAQIDADAGSASNAEHLANGAQALAEGYRTVSAHTGIK